MTIEDALKLGHARYVRFMDRPRIGYVFVEYNEEWRVITPAKSTSTSRGVRWESVCEKVFGFRQIRR